ncbi:DUF6082 family protein [Streptomyces sp. NPDC048288]|uniref:DUF6082 family protein n=1 Tax=Streptomyces sp. NPDC048288 TaxID=3365529 RepID=UPI00371F23FF
MATKSRGTRALTAATAAGLAWAAGGLALLLAQQRRQQETQLRLEQQRLHFQLLSRAIDDPELAAVMSTVTLDDVAPQDRVRVRRQYLFANALYVNVLQMYRAGTVNWPELHGHLRVLCQSALFREYWEATRHHRDSLAPASEEARVGRMMDKIVRDLVEADTEQWWVVGEPPPPEDSGRPGR